MKTVKIPNKEAEFLTEVAQKTSLSKEAIVRNALRSYLYQKRWRALQKYGKTLAKKFKIKNEEEIGQIVD